MNIGREWTQDLLKRDDLVMILNANLIVKEHPISEGLAGHLYCVGGIVECVDAINDLLERRIKNKEKIAQDSMGDK